jgi:hypothetical protein
MPALSTGLAALSAAGALASFTGQRNANRAAEMRGEFEAGLLETQAGMLGESALDVERRADIEVGRHRAAARRLKGAQRASMAAQGLDLASGSAAAIQEETEFLSELDALTIKNDAAREAWGYRVAAWDARGRAALARMGGGGPSPYSTLLTGAAQTGAFLVPRFENRKK